MFQHQLSSKGSIANNSSFEVPAAGRIRSHALSVTVRWMIAGKPPASGLSKRENVYL